MLKLIKSTFKTIKSTIFAIILICAIAFMVNNREPITLHLFPLPFTIETRVFMIMITCFALGFACGLTLLSGNIIKNAINNFKNRKTKIEKPVDLQS